MPSNATVVDFVRSQVELKMKLSNANPLAIRDIANDIPVLVKAAIIDLQRNDILPPKSKRFVAIDEIDQELDTDDELAYYFFPMPEKFRELKKIMVDGIESYRMAQDEEELMTTTNTYMVDQVVTDQGLDYRLRLNPFPDFTQEILYRYYEDGTDLNFGEIKETYWDAILHNVYARMGLISEYQADSKMSDLVSQIKHPDGIGGNNKIRKRKPFYFGK